MGSPALESFNVNFSTLVHGFPHTLRWTQNVPGWLLCLLALTRECPKVLGGCLGIPFKEITKDGLDSNSPSHRISRRDRRCFACGAHVRVLLRRPEVRRPQTLEVAHGGGLPGRSSARRCFFSDTGTEFPVQSSRALSPPMFFSMFGGSCTYKPQQHPKHVPIVLGSIHFCFRIRFVRGGLKGSPKQHSPLKRPAIVSQGNPPHREATPKQLKSLQWGMCSS